jgi:FkbM family methyltransferase
VNVVRDIFEEYENHKDVLETSIEEVKRELGEFVHHILLYGAGSAGIAFLYFLRRFQIEPLFFVDSNEEKIGRQCEGLEIISPADVTKRAGDDALIIVCINTDGKRYCKSFDEALRKGGHHGVYEKLKSCGCRNIIDYTYFRRCHELFRGEQYNAPSCSDVFLMEHHQEDIAEVYDWLADDLSREVYEKILRFRLLDDSLEVPTMAQDKQYFEYGFYEKRPDEVFVDCGAFNGISLRTFLKENDNRFDGYYGLEPDPANYRMLQQYVEELPPEQKSKVSITQKAAWMDGGGTRLYALKGPGSFVADIGGEEIETTTIDQLLNGKRATYIKMNIEGSEKQALEGAQACIRTYKPRLAIAGYHRTEDFWRIPQIIRGYREDYRMYLRSYMNHISFVYYSI